MRHRKIAMIGGVAGLVIVALFIYAVLNLNRIISQNRDYVLARISDSIGRSVEVQNVGVSLGWGIVLKISGLKVADDPAFSQLPIVEAGEVDGEAEFFPLLFGRLHLKRLVFKEPQVRIIRDARGVLNLSEIGKKSGGAKEPAAEKGAKPLSGAAVTRSEGEEAATEAKPGGSAVLEKFAIKTFSLQGGKVSYSDLAAGGQPLEVTSIDLNVRHFSVSGSFEVSGSLAALGTEQNLSVSGEVGPLMRAGTINAAAMPLDLKVTVGPLKLDRVRQIPGVGGAIPRQLAISDAVEAKAGVSGTLDALKFAMDTDLSSPRVTYAGLFDKPPGVRLRLSASGGREKGAVTIEQASLSLAGLDLTAGHVRFGQGVLQARMDTNRFDFASVGKVLPAAGAYNPTGTAEIHADVRLQTAHAEPTAGTRVTADGTIGLSRVTLTPAGGSLPAVANLNANIRMIGNGAMVGPVTFDLGSGHANLQAELDTFYPLKGNFQFNEDILKIEELVPSRKSESPEELRQISVNGTLGGTMSDPQVTADVVSPGGSVSNVAYQNLVLGAAYGDKRVDVRSLKLNAFGGAIAASALATLSEARPFQAKLNLDNIDLEQTLASQKAKAAGVVRGYLTGNVEVSGSGAKFEQIKPTLRGGGKATIRDGKLVGVNVVAQALKQANGIPGVGDIVTPDVAARHPELFSSPDTDIRQAALTFTIEGPRITSHDIVVDSTDYRLRADGSFDMDKNIDMRAQISLTKGLSDELEAHKKNVAYLTNTNGEVEIPLQIVGVLPKPRVMPDVQMMAQTAAKRALQAQTGKVLGGILGGKRGKGGLGGLLGGSGGSGNPLEKLFH